jgi:hypothetical protein
LQPTFIGLLLCRDFMIVSPEHKPIGKAKVQNIIYCSPAFGQPELLLISEHIAHAALCLPA